MPIKNRVLYWEMVTLWLVTAVLEFKMQNSPDIRHILLHNCCNQVLGSYPALFLLLLGILVLHAAHTGHACQTVEAGDALARVLALNSQVCWTKATDVKRAAWQIRKALLIVQPFVFSGVFKAPCMTACASSFLVLRASMVSFSSTSSVSYKHIMGSWHHWPL